MNLATRYKLLMAITGLCLCCFIIFAAYFHLRLQARELADISLHSIADRKIAELIYYGTVVRPKLIEALKAGNAADHFDPTLLSGAFIAKNQQEIYDYIGTGHYKVRPFAINARTAVHEASELERHFLNKLNADRELSFESHFLEIDGKPHLVHLHKVSVHKKSCMECHGTPEQALEGLVKIYGRDKGFNRKIGQVVGGLSVSVSLQPFYAQTHSRALKLSAQLIGALTALQFFVYWFSTRFIFTAQTQDKEQ